MEKHFPNPASICFIGTGSRFSFTAFQTLCEQSVKITQVILSGHAPATLPDTCLPVSVENAAGTRENSLAQLAGQHGIPVTFLGRVENRQQQWQQLCADVTHHPQPDFIFMACFPEKLPDVALNWPQQKCVNLHPSLLPRYRGPDPIFWQQHYNETQTGISLHKLTDELDAGPLLSQREVRFPPGATRAELDTLLARQGALAFVDLLDNGKFITTAQDETQATYQPLPEFKNNNEVN